MMDGWRNVDKQGWFAGMAGLDDNKRHTNCDKKKENKLDRFECIDKATDIPKILHLKYPIKL